MKNSKNLFWKIFAISMAALVVLCIAALIVGYSAMMDYERAQKAVPSIAAEYAQKITDGDYLCLLDSKKSPAALEFERDAFISEIKNKVEAAGGCTSKKGFSTDRYERPVYVLMAGDEKIAELEFQKVSTKSAFGFAQFELSEVRTTLSGKHELVLLVPESGEIYINDIKVPASYKTGEKVDQSTLPNVLEASTQNEKLVYYKIEGLLSDVSMYFINEGETEKKDFRYSKANAAWMLKDDTREITIDAPSDADVYVNDIKITGETRFIVESGIAIDEIKKAKEYVSCDATITRYSIAGIKGTINVAAKSKNGETYNYSYDEATDTYTFANGYTPADLSKYGTSKDFLMTRAKEYAKFVSNDGSRDTQVLPYVYGKSQAYKDFKEFWATLSKHNSYWFENEKLETVEFYNDNLFKATVSFDYWIKGFNHQTDNTKVYPNRVTFWYGKFENSWKIIDYSLS